MSTVLSKSAALARSKAPEPIVLSNTDGVYLFDENGRRFIDFMSSYCVGNFGWAMPVLKNAIRSYSGPDYVSPNLAYRPWDDLADRLTSIAPAGLDKCFRATGGSEAVDTALQIAMAYTGRKKFVSVEESYHGNTIGPLSVGASSTRENLPALLPGCHKIKMPLDDKALQRLETQLKKKDVAAFIMEPVLTNCGATIPQVAFVSGAAELCKKYGTLFIADEVATGFGRTGKIFAIGHFDVKPDIMCVAKGFTGGYAPIGATLTTSKIFKKVRDKLNIYSTYGWHPLCTHVALAALTHIERRKDKLLAHVEDASQHFRNQLSQMSFKHGGRLNIIGLSIGIDLENPKYAEKVKTACVENGLLIANHDENLVMFPPLNITQERADEGLQILKNCI